MLADRFHEPIRNWSYNGACASLWKEMKLAMNVANLVSCRRVGEKSDDMTVGIVQLFLRL